MLQEKPEEFILAVENKIRTVHIADYDGIDEKHWMPGKVINNWNKIIAALTGTQYNGPFMYELTKQKTDTFSFKNLKPNYEGLLKYFANSESIE